MTRPAEATSRHTTILRCTLAVPDARTHGSVPDRGLVDTRVDRAFQGFWFDARRHACVAVLLLNTRRRFDAFPESLAGLRRRPDRDPATRAAICHRYLQLADPMYRALNGGFLARRRAGPRSPARSRSPEWARRTACTMTGPGR